MLVGSKGAQNAAEKAHRLLKAANDPPEVGGGGIREPIHVLVERGGKARVVVGATEARVVVGATGTSVGVAKTVIGGPPGV